MLFIALGKEQQAHADKRQHRRERRRFAQRQQQAVALKPRQRQNPARDRRADVCAHNHADRLRQGHQPRIDETDDHDRRRGGGLHHRRDGDAREHGEEAVARDHAQQLFQPCTRRFFQRFAHQLHSEQEQPQSAEQG